MAGPSLHPSESLADRILSLLPRTSPCASDVCIDMSPLSSTRGKWGLNGNLAQPNHPRAKHILKTIICSKQKVTVYANINNDVIVYILGVMSCVNFRRQE